MLVAADRQGGTREDVEEEAIFPSEVFADVARPLFIEISRQQDPPVKDLLDIAAAGVVALDQRFELFVEVGARAVEHLPDNRRLTLETDEQLTQHSSTPEDRIVRALASAEGEICDNRSL